LTVIAPGEVDFLVQNCLFSLRIYRENAMSIQMMFNDDVHQTNEQFPSGAIVVIVVAALAISSVLVTLVCLAINSRRRRRNQQLPDLLRHPPIIFAPPSQVHPATLEMPTYYITQNGVPKPINLEAPPTYEEAMSAPTSPVPLASPGAVSTIAVDGVAPPPTPRTRLSIEIERNAMQQRLSSLPPEDRPSTSRV
ncbi:hypothetical protein PMAYCL1PPCAC_16816, partial [Pristionchus mayeri]